jgi:hypothetical protein
MSMIGKPLAHNSVTAEIGKGGMGKVYQAKISKPAKSILLGALALLFSMIPSLPGAPDEILAIFYVAGDDTHYELQVYHPSEGTQTILELPGEPLNIYWTRDFKTISFRVGREIFESDWRIRSRSQKTVTLPPESNDVYRQITAWYETDSEAWRYYEIQYPSETAKEWKYFARVFQFNNKTKKWDKLIDRETYGCEQGDSTCGYEVRRYTEGQERHIFQTRLTEEMRLANIMNILGLEYEESMEGKDLWFEFGGAELSVVPIFGDTLHATAPVKWRKGSEIKIIFASNRDYTCENQIGLTRIGRFLLVAGEWNGRCGRVIDLKTGETVHELPANAKNAVVVPWPKGE